MKRTFSTELAYVFGIVFVARGVVLMEKADFGVSMVVAPAYLLYRWLSPVWSFVTFGMAEYCLQVVLLLAMCLLLRFRASYLFSFVTAVVYGFVLDAFMLLGAALPAGSVWLRVIYYALGMFFCAAGVSAMFHTYSKHIRCPDTRSKCAFQPCGQTAHFDFWDAPKPCLIFAKSPWIRGIARELNDIFLDEYPCVPMGDDGVCSFLFVGRIMKEKGVDEFFSAARTLKAEFGEEVAFDVVGFYEDAYKEQVDQLVADGIVRFHGFQTDVHPFYEAADCVVLPSYHEGMSNVLLEGAATGRALITSDIPGCREAVEDGVSGYLCPAQDAEGLTQAMRDFAQQSFDRQVQMGQSGRALVERKFDKQLVVAKTLDGLGLPAAVRS